MLHGTRAVRLAAQGAAIATFAMVPAGYAAAGEPAAPPSASALPLAPSASALPPVPSASALPPVPSASALPPVPSVNATLAAPTPPPAQGLAVVAFPGSTDAAWPLATSVYGDRALRARSVDEASARVLCGDAPQSDAPPSLRDLAQTVAALRNDDAPSRVLLAEIARRYAVRALVAVWADAGGHPTAHVFLPESGTFDAAVYSPDSATAAGRPASWSGAVQSLDRVFGPAGSVGALSPPRLATHEVPQEKGGSHGHFYESPWFWGGIGAAAAAAAAIYLSTRDTSSPTIHLELQVPK